MFRRRKPPALPAPPQRQGHPNARIEAEFQRIVSLRRDIARKEAELDAAPAEIDDLRRTAVHYGGATAKTCTAQANALEARLPVLATEIQELHDQIAKAIEPFDDDDLLFL
jgi:cell division protein FtsB